MTVVESKVVLFEINGVDDGKRMACLRLLQQTSKLPVLSRIKGYFMGRVLALVIKKLAYKS